MGAGKVSLSLMARRRGLCTAVQLSSTIQASQPDPGGPPDQHSEPGFAAVSTAESRSWAWVIPNIRIAWISAGNVPPYPGGCLCVIFMLVRKLIIPFSRLCEPGGLPLNTWSPSWGWGVACEHACLHAGSRGGCVCCGHRPVQTETVYDCRQGGGDAGVM